MTKRRLRVVHGHRRSFVHVGEGPSVLLIHGIGDSSETWADVPPLLAAGYTVVAPDLLGASAGADSEPERHGPKARVTRQRATRTTRGRPDQADPASCPPNLNQVRWMTLCMPINACGRPVLSSLTKHSNR